MAKALNMANQAEGVSVKSLVQIHITPRRMTKNIVEESLYPPVSPRNLFDTSQVSPEDILEKGGWGT